MKLADTMKLVGIDAAAAGTQATVADSRSADEWIKKFLDDKNQRLNDLRRKLNHLLGPEKGEWHAAYRNDKLYPEQDAGRVGGSGNWVVVSPEDEIISRWDTKDEADDAAIGAWNGVRTAMGLRVKRLQDVKAADIFQDPDYGDKTRAKFLKHPKPRIVRDADTIRMGLKRIDDWARGQGAAGTGGTGSGSGL